MLQTNSLKFWHTLGFDAIALLKKCLEYSSYLRKLTFFKYNYTQKLDYGKLSITRRGFG